MAGGRWRRRTPTGGPTTRWSATPAADLANAPDYPAFLDRMGEVFARAVPRPAAGSLRGGHRARRVPAGPLPVRRGGPRGTSRGRRARPEGRPHLAPGRDAAAAVRLSAGRSSRTSPTSTSSCSGASRRPSGAAATLEVGREDVAVDVVAHRPGLGRDRHRRGRCALDGRARRRPRRGSSCGSSPAARRGTGPASRRRASRAAAPRRPDRGTPISSPRSSSGMSSRRTTL